MTADEFRRKRPDLPPHGRPRVPVASAEERTTRGIRFASRGERDWWEAKRIDPNVRLIIRQPMLDVAGVVVRPDFLVLMNDGTFKVVDVKAKGGNKDHRARTERNRKMVWETYGIEIEVVR